MLHSNTLNIFQINDWYYIEFFVLDRNTWDQLTVWKQMIDIK